MMVLLTDLKIAGLIVKFIQWVLFLDIFQSIGLNIKFEFSVMVRLKGSFKPFMDKSKLD
jgi:hypothetical protein